MVRHALRRGVWCASRRPPLGVCFFLSLFALPHRFSLQRSCPGHLEHLECSRQPHIQGRGAKKRTQRAG